VLATGLAVGQATTSVRGTVTDPAGSAIVGAKVALSNVESKTERTATTGGQGEYQFLLIPPGTYTLKVTAAGFRSYEQKGLELLVNTPATANVQLKVGATTEIVTVTSEAPALNLVDASVGNSFDEKQVRQIPLEGRNVPDLLSLQAGVAYTGNRIGDKDQDTRNGAVNGARSDQSNVTLDGVDVNDQSNGYAFTSVLPVTQDSVQEFRVTTTNYGADQGQGSGAQVALVTKSGTNSFHGSLYEFFRNRKLNALDTLDKIGANVVRENNPPIGFERQRRYDYNRYGFNFGGPLYFPRFGEGGKEYYPWSGKDKLFFFVSLENLHFGFNSGASQLRAPTALGLAQILSVPGVSHNNFGVFQRFVPVAPLSNGESFALGARNVDLGLISVPAPFTEANRNIVLNFDFNQSSTTTHHSRFIWNRLRQTDNLATLPAFFTQVPTDDRLFSYTMNHTFSPKLTNELRLSYRRHVNRITVPALSFPGLDQFPNIDLDDIFGGGSIGPDPNAPQTTIENNYQVVDNISMLFGNHSLKFGGDFRKLISPQTFVQRQRGDYEYITVADFLLDLSPVFGERNVGASTFYGDQRLLFAYAQDDWRLRPNLTLNLGVNYVYEQMPFGARQQSLNQAASVPGLLTFNSPKSQVNPFDGCAAAYRSSRFVSARLWYRTSSMTPEKNNSFVVWPATTFAPITSGSGSLSLSVIAPSAAGASGALPSSAPST